MARVMCSVRFCDQCGCCDCVFVFIDIGSGWNSSNFAREAVLHCVLHISVFGWILVVPNQFYVGSFVRVLSEQYGFYYVVGIFCCSNADWFESVRFFMEVYVPCMCGMCFPIDMLPFSNLCVVFGWQWLCGFRVDVVRGVHSPGSHSYSLFPFQTVIMLDDEGCIGLYWRKQLIKRSGAIRN